MNRVQFLQRLIGVVGVGQISIKDLLPKRKIFLLQCFVAGFRFYKGMGLLEAMKSNDYVELRREPENEHDLFAIALYWQNEKIGFIPADFNEVLARLMDAKALPLLGVITHLNKQVKPWENVVVGIYFLQEEVEPLPEHAGYLQEVIQPTYSSLPSNKFESKHLHREMDNEKINDDFFNYNTRIINLEKITNAEAKAYYTKNYGDKKVYLNGVLYALVNDDGHYEHIYQNKPLHWVLADDGKEYIEFEYVDV
jgi:hypothetical protein